MSKLLRNGIPRTEDGKIDFSWKNHYGFTGLIVLLGFLFPPLAVAIRFGIGKDFFINVLLTICGIIPGHIHNWFIQNVRNNDTKARTPKWAIRYGLVDDRPAKKLMKKRAWTGRFNDRLPPSQRVVYDDEGNAHVVEEEEVETRHGITTTAPWNVHAVGPVREQTTGLVEPDQWINEEPSQPKINYTPPPTSSSSSKPSKLARFKRSGNSNKASLPSAENHAWVDDARRRRGSMDSTTSSNTSGLMTPEDPTRSFSPYTSNARKDSRADDNIVVSHHQEAPVRRREDDIFAHEF